MAACGAAFAEHPVLARRARGERRRGYKNGRDARQHKSRRTNRAKSETWKQKRANMRATVCMRVRVRVRVCACACACARARPNEGVTSSGRRLENSRRSHAPRNSTSKKVPEALRSRATYLVSQVASRSPSFAAHRLDRRADRARCARTATALRSAPSRHTRPPRATPTARPAHAAAAPPHCLPRRSGSSAPPRPPDRQRCPPASARSCAQHRAPPALGPACDCSRRYPVAPQPTCPSTTRRTLSTPTSPSCR